MTSAADGHAIPPLPPRLVLFDGVCVVCDAGMTWLIDHDPSGLFHYAPLQGPTAAAVRARHPEWPDHLDSIVFVTQGEGGESIAFHSEAVFQIASLLPAPWSWLGCLRVIPRPLRDLAYRAFASVRYRVFGVHEACRVPTPEEAARFLD
jgi:predicted DCC family thiol-disulfide oxidoreductase YuxK